MDSVKVKECQKRIVRRSVQTGFCILGDWIIEFDESKYHQTNQEYRVICLREYHKQRQIMEVHLQRKKSVDKNVNIILDILGNSAKDTHRAFYPILLRYQAIINQYTSTFKMIKLLMHNPISSSIIAKDLSDLRENFNSQIKIILDKQLSGVDFFFYTITSNNYDQEMQEKTKMGYSNRLMILLARSIDNFEHVYLKERSCEIFDQVSMLDILTSQVLEQSTTKCTLTTLDNIQLSIDVDICILCHESNDAFAQKYNLLKGFFKDSVICIYYPKIQQHHLDLLYRTRKDQKKSQPKNWDNTSLNDEDSYSQNEIISKFYTPDNTKLEDKEESFEKMKMNILYKQRRKFGSSQKEGNDNQICDKLSDLNLD